MWSAMDLSDCFNQSCLCNASKCPMTFKKYWRRKKHEKKCVPNKWAIVDVRTYMLSMVSIDMYCALRRLLWYGQFVLFHFGLCFFHALSFFSLGCNSIEAPFSEFTLVSHSLGPYSCTHTCMCASLHVSVCMCHRIHTRIYNT